MTDKLTLQQIQQQCYAAGLTLEDVRMYGEINNQETWEKAYAELVTEQKQDIFKQVLGYDLDERLKQLGFECIDFSQKKIT